MVKRARRDNTDNIYRYLFQVAPPMLKSANMLKGRSVGDSLRLYSINRFNLNDSASQTKSVEQRRKLNQHVADGNRFDRHLWLR